LSYVFFLCRLVLFVSTLAKCLAGKTFYSRDIFRDDGFPYKDQIDELLIVMVSHCIFQHATIFNFLINFNLCNIF